MTSKRKLLNSELNRLSLLEFKNTVKTPIIVVLDNVRSLYNVGSVFRTGDAFKIEAIYLCGITGTPPHNEINKSALGATESLEWKYFKNTEDAIQKLKSDHYKILCFEQVENSISLEDFMVQNGSQYALVFGNEIKGVKQEVINLCDSCIEIPQYGTKHSLNISVTAGIVIWYFFQQLKT